MFFKSISSKTKAGISSLIRMVLTTNVFPHDSEILAIAFPIKFWTALLPNQTQQFF